MNAKRGVSLIVLAITVIVMIILASAVVITLKDGADMIGNSKTAVNETDKSNIQIAVNTLMTKMMVATKDSVSVMDAGTMEEGKIKFCITGDTTKVITKKKENGVEKFAIAQEGDTPYTLTAEDLGLTTEKLSQFKIDTSGMISLVENVQ